MTWNRRVVVCVAGGLFAVALLVVGVRSWLAEHDAGLRTSLQTRSQQSDLDALKQQERQSRDALQQELAALEERRREQATPEALVKETSELVPALAEPLEVQPAPDDARLPDGPRQEEVVIPAADVRGLRDAELACEETAASLKSCEQVSTDRQKQIGLTEQQRDEWKATAQGGNWWHRTVHSAKWFAVGVGAGLAIRAVAER